MTFWTLLKKFVKDTELLNRIQFSNAAWDRVKHLEREIVAQAWHEQEVLREQLDELRSHDAHVGALGMILDERRRQEQKWGQQNHTPELWLMILQEELGETAAARLQKRRADYLTELVQTAAVAVAWLDCELRRSAIEETAVESEQAEESGLS